MIAANDTGVCSRLIHVDARTIAVDRQNTHAMPPCAVMRSACSGPAWLWDWTKLQYV